MSKFRGSNSMTSPRDLFYHRANFYQEAYYKADGPTPEVRDLHFAENTLYGRVDTRLNTVYPNENKMVNIPSGDNPQASYRLTNFVADAFINLRSRMSQAKDIGTIPDTDPVFSRFSIKRAYQSPFNLYSIYVQDLMEDYITNFLYDENYKKHVFTFKNFIDNFIIFLQTRTEHTPFTFTSWQRSKTSSIFTSGMAVEISTAETGEDESINDAILSSDCFPLYLKLCRANGFLVSRINPSIIVADIMSPGLLPFAEDRVITSTEDVFLRNYEYAYTIDYDTMLLSLVDGYNLFVSRFPFESIEEARCVKTSHKKIVNREGISLDNATQAYSPAYYFSAYSKIRNIEEEGAIDERTMNSLLKQIKNTKNLDKFKIMRYINSMFRNTYKSKYGGANYFVYKQQEKYKDSNPSIDVMAGTSESLPDVEPITTTVTTTTSTTGGGSSGGY